MPGAPNSANRTMWTANNIGVLRGLNSESIDLVYANPPFNRNKTYSAPIGSKDAVAEFKDTWMLSDIDREEQGEIADASCTGSRKASPPAAVTHRLPELRGGSQDPAGEGRYEPPR